MSSNFFDSIIIGGGISGLVIAQALTRSGQSVAVLEAQPYVGGMAHQNVSPFGVLPNCLSHIPGGPASKRAIEFLEILLGESLEVSEVESSPITFQKGNFAPFVGFGAQAPESADEISYYSGGLALQVISPTWQWLEKIQSLGCGTVYPNSQVTRLIMQDQRIAGLWVNGQASPLKADNFIFCAPARQLLSLLPKEALGARAASRLSHSRDWSSILLQLVHNQPISDQHELHVLFGGTEEVHSCIGRFEPKRSHEGKEIQASSWATFVHSDAAHEEEITGAALREIKRQIKRAYPTALEKPLFEKISVFMGSHGEVPLKLSAQGTIPGISNLYVASRGLSSFKNLTGTLFQAQLVLAAMGIPLGHDISESVAQTRSDDFIETTVDL